MSRWRSSWSLTLLPFLLAGCASLEPVKPVDQAVSAGTVRTYHDNIDLGGRLSLRYQQNGKEEALHGSFTWTQSTAHTTLTLLSPLGQTLATIDVTPAASTLTQAGKPPRTAADVDSLTAEALGWPLPVAGLRDWLQGFAQDAQNHRFTAQPQATDSVVTTRDGWHIRYDNWQASAGTSTENYAKRIDLERNTTEAGAVSIRIVLDTWQPH